MRAGIMDEERNFKYFTFPIFLVKGMFDNPKKTINNIFEYCGYAIANKINDGNDEIEAINAAGKLLGITFGNPKRTYNTGKKLFLSMQDKAPMASIQKDLLFDFYGQ